jgi:hypothetical protein
LEEKIEEDKEVKKRDRGTTQQAEEDTNGCFGAPHGKEGGTGWRSP